MARYRCTVCNWVYDEEAEGVPFADVPETWTCPQCGAPKSAFVPETRETAPEDVETTVADKLVEQLVALGVREIYGIPGDSNLPLVDAVRRDGRIRFVLTRHEQTAAFMASARGKITGEIGVCLSIAGPGSTNLVTGLMDAASDRSPVLALVGQVPEVYLGSEAFQEIDQLELFHPFSLFSETLARGNQAAKLALSAAKHAYRGPGVSVLSTPTDVLAERSGGSVFVPEKRLFRGEPEPLEDEIDRAADVVNSAARVAILAGWGARHSRGAILELSEKLKAPVATTSRAKGVIDETGRRALGVLGSIGTVRAARSLQGADVVIVAGSGFRHANLIPGGTRLIQIDRDATHIGRTFDIDVGIHGDADAALRRLTDRVEAKGEDEEWWSRIDELRDSYFAELEADARDHSMPINPGFVIQALRRHVAADAVITVDVGDHTYWFYKKFVCEGQQTYLSGNIASMGFGFPAALAAQLAYPDRQVVCVTGDGGFGMVMADFTTAVREELPVTVIVFNDESLKNIKKEMARDGYPAFGVDFPNPDFAAFAQTAGGVGYRVEEPGDLDAAIEAALGSGRPALVDVVVDRDRMAASASRVEE
jgi:pyruvate oxidase